MDGTKIIPIKDGDPMLPVIETPPISEKLKQSKLDGTVKKKRRRGKPKRKIMKPLLWQERRKNDNKNRNNRYRTLVITKTHAPFNNNQFLMEIHKPEPENTFQILNTPSARTRDSSFSVDSDDNYFYSLPEDEEEYLTKEFSSVYEDAQSERLSNMSKNELVQEYLLLEAKYENLVKRMERSVDKSEEDQDTNAKNISLVTKDGMITDTSTDKDTGSSVSTVDEVSLSDILQRMKEQEEKIQELEMANEKLRLENEHLRQGPMDSSSEDSESDSSSSDSASSSSDCENITNKPFEEMSQNQANGHHTTNGQNEVAEEFDAIPPLMNGFHSPDE